MKKILVFAWLIIAFVGCDDSSNTNLRFINSSADSPALDLVIDDDRAFRGTTFSSATDYLEYSSGEKDFEIRPANSTSTLSSFTFDLDDDTNYSIIAIDALAQITPLILVDDDEQPGKDEAKIRIVNASPTVQAVDVYASDGSVSLESVDPVVSNLSFGSASDYLVVPYGTYKLRVTRAGTKVEIASRGSINLEEEGIYTAIVQDHEDGGLPLGISVIDDVEAADDLE